MLLLLLLLLLLILSLLLSCHFLYKPTYISRYFCKFVSGLEFKILNTNVWACMWVCVYVCVIVFVFVVDIWIKISKNQIKINDLKQWIAVLLSPPKLWGKAKREVEWEWNSPVTFKILTRIEREINCVREKE